MNETILNTCPCSETPDELYIEPGNNSKYAFVSGNCCGYWCIEFKTKNHDLDSVECMDLAVKEWNRAIVGEREDTLLNFEDV